MEAATLNRIIELTLQAEARNRLTTDTPAIIIGDEIKSIEHLGYGRSRFRGTYSTHVLDEFKSYLEQHPAECFINPEKMVATAFVNLGTSDDPGHADWRANLVLKPTAAYEALVKINGAQHDQRAMAEWMEDWADYLDGEHEGVHMPLSVIIAAVREITVSQKKDQTTSERDFGATRSVLEDIEARSKKGLPTSMDFRAVPYVGFEPRVFPLRLSIITGEKPRLVLRISGYEQIQEEMANEFRDKLKQGAGSTVMRLGTFSP